MATIKTFSALDRIGNVLKQVQGGADNYNQLSQAANQTLAQSINIETQKRQQAIEFEKALTQATGKNMMGSGVGDEYVRTGKLPSLGEQLQMTPMTPKAEAEINNLKNRNKKAQYDADQLGLPVEQRDDYKKAIAVAGVKANTALDQMNARNDMENKQKIKAAQIADFDIADPNIIPSSKDAEEVKKLNASNKSFQEIGKETVEMVKRADPRNPKYFLSNDWRMLNQKLTKMKLQAKNLEDLGVLNGPDLGLVNETFGSITPAQLALLGPEAAAKRLQSATETAERVMVNAAAARNYKRKGAPSANQEQAPAAPKQGTVDGGFIFLGGDPSKPENWAKANS